MPTIIAIAVAVAVFVWWARRSAPAGPGGAGCAAARRRCAFEPVDPASERALREYRCRHCGETAYGRADTPPADRPCKAIAQK